MRLRGAAVLGLLASLGLAQVQVQRKLRAAFFSTGDEVLSLGEPPRQGAVYDSNRYTLFGMLTRIGVDVLDMGVVRDDPVALQAAFAKAALLRPPATCCAAAVPQSSFSRSARRYGHPGGATIACPLPPTIAKLTHTSPHPPTPRTPPILLCAA